MFTKLPIAGLALLLLCAGAFIAYDHWPSDGGSAAKFLEAQRAEAEQRLADILANPQATKADFTEAFEDFRRQRAIENQTLYRGEKKRDPRSEMEKAAAEFWAVGVEYVGGLPDWDTFNARREAILQAHPGLSDWLKRNEVANWIDPNVKQAVAQVLEAYDVRREYYAIPAFYELSLEDGDTVNQILSRARSMAELGQAPSVEIAIYTLGDKFPDEFPDKLVAYALLESELRSPARANFKKKHPELAWFEDVSLDDGG